MEVDGIGGTTTATNDSNNAISQDEFVKLFLAQLNFQDPLEPVDNREFLTQMAQFSQLELARSQDTSLGNLVLFKSADHGISLLGKTVEATINQTNFSGTVNAVNITEFGAKVSIETTDGANITDISLSDITVIR